MKISRRALAEVIGERTLHITDLHELARHIAAYIIHEKYTGGLESLMRDVMRYRMEHDRLEAIATSAHDLDERVMKDIVDMLKEEFPKAKSVHVSHRTDPTVIGGVRLDLPGEQLDLTVKAKLNTLRRLTA